MKFTAALGGFLGFALGVIGGLIGGREPGSLLLQSMLGCVIGAMLFRWLHRLFLRSLAHAHRERREIVERQRREQRAAKRASGPAAANL